MAADEREPEPEPEPADESPTPQMPSKDSAEEDELFGDGPDDDAQLVMDKEDDEGNVEYKLQLINPSPERFIHLVTQCQFRVSEGAPPVPRPAPRRRPARRWNSCASLLLTV